MQIKSRAGGFLLGFFYFLCLRGDIYFFAGTGWDRKRGGREKRKEERGKRKEEREGYTGRYSNRYLARNPAVYSTGIGVFQIEKKSENKGDAAHQDVEFSFSN